jgi:hypothetical protein
LAPKNASQAREKPAAVSSLQRFQNCIAVVVANATFRKQMPPGFDKKALWAAKN